MRAVVWSMCQCAACACMSVCVLGSLCAERALPCLELRTSRLFVLCVLFQPFVADFIRDARRAHPEQLNYGDTSTLLSKRRKQRKQSMTFGYLPKESKNKHPMLVRFSNVCVCVFVQLQFMRLPCNASILQSYAECPCMIHLEEGWRCTHSH